MLSRSVWRVSVGLAAVLCGLACGDETGFNLDEVEGTLSTETIGTARAVPTFESLGLYWAPAGRGAARACKVQYRVSGTAAWRQGLDLWYDARNGGEYRGSLVHLKSGTLYDVELSLTGTPAVSTTGTVRTWSDAFPIASTVRLPSSSSATLNITTSGTPSGYVLYTVASTGSSVIDAANAQDFNIRITGSYVIVRGLTLRGARRDAIRLEAGAHDVVIEDNDISGWGRVRDTSTGLGANGDSAIHVAWRINGADRIIVQRNNIHAPRYDSNSWATGHPAGPLALQFEQCAGLENPTCGSNHVIRYNDIRGDASHYLMDGIGGGENFSAYGFPNADSDIYGNKIAYVWDDGIEAEGGNKNVRIWGNYIDQSFTGIATAASHLGPIYIWRNVYDVSRKTAGNNDSVEHGPFGKLGDNAGFGGGRRYFFHNTLLQQPPPSGQTRGQGAGSGLSGGCSERPMVDVVTRNNVWHTYTSNSYAFFACHSASKNNNFNNDLYNGVIQLAGTGNVVGAGMMKGLPIYAAGNGAVSKDGGLYALASGSLGFDRGEVLPGFNDGYSGAAPDVGAHEANTPAMKFGRAAATPPTTTEPPPPPPPSPTPTVSFVRPTAGQTLSGTITQSSACEVSGTGISRVVFFLDSTQLNTDSTAPWNCDLVTTAFSNAAHTLRAVAYDAAGLSASAQVGIIIQNGTVTPPPPPVAVLPVRINAGGGASAPFAADSGFSGGASFVNWTGAINTTGVTASAPPAVYQAERYGNMTYTLGGLTPGTLYDIRLHFCENYFSAAARRLFDVSINGALVLNDYDVFARSGAAHRANVQQIRVPASSTGQLVMVFTSVVNSALVNGIEVLAVPPLSLKINAGGGAVSPFLADQRFVGGAPFTNWTGAINITGLTSPAPAAVYQSERYGGMSYTLPGLVPGASYLVRLHFCENYFSAAARRRFDVTINGALVLDDFDVFATAGAAHKGVIRELEVDANASGQLVVVFGVVLNQPLINGIEVLSIP
jgi:hypothetical protein